jgi:hypothetical protein
MATNINIPFVASMQSDGQADLQTVKATPFLLGAAKTILAATLSSDIINAFEISHEDASDGTVSLNVTMKDKAAFVAALKAALQAATITTVDEDIHLKYRNVTSGEGAGEGNTLENYIKAAIHTDVIVALANNTIASELEASDVQPVTLDNFADDCETAATAMYEGLEGIGDGLRRVIATQVSNAKYTEDGEGFTSALPLVSGDSMSFQFSLTSNLTISEQATQLATNDDEAGEGPGVGTYTDLDGNVAAIMGTGTRAFRLVLTVA